MKIKMNLMKILVLGLAITMLLPLSAVAEEQGAGTTAGNTGMVQEVVDKVIAINDIYGFVTDDGAPASDVILLTKIMDEFDDEFESKARENKLNSESFLRDMHYTLTTFVYNGQVALILGKYASVEHVKVQTKLADYIEEELNVEPLTLVSSELWSDDLRKVFDEDTSEPIPAPEPVPVPAREVYLGQQFSLYKNEEVDVRYESMSVRLVGIQGVCMEVMCAQGTTSDDCASRCYDQVKIQVEKHHDDGRGEAQHLYLNEDGSTQDFDEYTFKRIKAYPEQQKATLVISRNSQDTLAVYLNKEFKLREYQTAEVVDFGKLEIKILDLGYRAIKCTGGSCPEAKIAYVRLQVSEKVLGGESTAVSVTLEKGEERTVFGAIIRANSIYPDSRYATFIVRNKNSEVLNVGLNRAFTMKEGMRAELVPNDITLDFHRVETLAGCPMLQPESDEDVKCFEDTFAVVSLSKPSGSTRTGIDLRIKEGSFKSAFDVSLIFIEWDETDREALFKFVKKENFPSEDEDSATFIPSHPVEIAVSSIPVKAQTREEKTVEVKKGSEETELTITKVSDPETGSCSGCIKDDICLSVGIRTNNGEAVYCDIDNQLKVQKENNAACQNNFECETNTCSSGKCLDLQKELEEQKSLLNKIFGWLSNIFG
jgi:hypothetical protein